MDLKGRDAGQIESLKKLIQDEEGARHKAKPKRKVVGYVSDGDEDDDEDGDKKGKKRQKKAAPEADGEKKKGHYRKGVWIDESTYKSKYRDRALERRKGANPDYNDELQRMVEVDAEHSKFLGGDLEHTHLVKGLDYALLVKMREEEAHKGVHDEEAELDEALETAEEKAKRNKLEEERNKVEVTTFTGKTIQSVWKVIQGEARGDVIDFSRVAYEYEIGDGADLTLPSIPTIVARSKTEDAVQDEADRYMNYQVDEGLLQRLRDTMSLFKEGKHGKLKRIKKRQRGSNGTAARGSGSTSKQAAVLAPKISSIFDDVTEKYVPDELREEVPAPAKSSADDGATPGAGSGSKVKKSRWGVAPAAAEKDGEKKREKLAQGTYFAGLTKDGKAATESILVAPSRDEINKSIRNAAGKGKAAPPTKVVPEKKDPKIIDRDIFGGGKKGKASDRGHAMDKATTEYGESFDYDFADDFEYEKMKNKQKNMPSLKKEGSDAGKTEKKGRRERPKGGKEVE